LPLKVGVMSPSSYGSAAHDCRLLYSRDLYDPTSHRGGQRYVDFVKSSDLNL